MNALIIRSPVKKGLKLFLVIPMNNTAGLSLAMGTTFIHAEVYCMSQFSEEKLLHAIESIKVFL